MEWKTREPLSVEERSEKLENLRADFQKRSNPMYVWEAFLICTESDLPSIALPDWCVSYFTAVAHRLLDLAILCDPKTRPTLRPGESSTDYWARMEPWMARNLSPAQALKRLPWALEISRQGWNAFQSRRRELDEISAAILDGAFKSEGEPRYIYDLMRIWDVDFETAEKRLKRGRRLATLSRPRRPNPSNPD
jgi:hypothetical protein